MNWTNINPTLEESKAHISSSTFNTQMQEEKPEDDEMIQLKKFQNPADNIERQACITLLSQFGDLLVANNITGLITSVLSNDCEFFLLSSTGRTPVQFCLKPSDLHNLYKGIHIQERKVRESYIDLEKGMACQVCNFKILYEGEDNPIDEIVAEMFTIKNNKISKYRAFAGKMTPAHGNSDPFEISRKDIVLAMVKQVNYALAGQPDFEKVADFLHENAKYKIWSWDSNKCFVLEKHNFVESFQTMQENLLIKSIVPYEIHTESKVAVSTYVYHLEGKIGKYINKKYVWLNTSYYLFDDDYKIIKVSQQGELHLEGEVKVPFAVYSREKLIQKVQKIYVGVPTVELFYSDVFALGVASYVFGPDETSFIGFNKGTAVVDGVIAWNMKNKQDALKKIKLVESMIDCCESGYDVVILIHKIYKESDHLIEEQGSTGGVVTFVLTRHKLEHGKIVEACGFIIPLTESIPSSFEDF